MSSIPQHKCVVRNKRFARKPSRQLQLRQRSSDNFDNNVVQNNSVVIKEEINIEGIQNQDLVNNPLIKKEETIIQKPVTMVKMEEEQIDDQEDYSSQSDNGKYSQMDVRKARKHFKKTQNLKNISSLIRLLIGNNQNLTVKSLSYLLYEIIGQTKFGLEILDCKYPMIGQQTHKQLHKKYLSEKNYEFQAKMLVRNVRRRLYDALNVMISANVIYKTSNILRMSSQLTQTTHTEIKKEIKMEDSQNFDQRTLLQKLKLQFRQRGQRIALKQKELDESKKQLNYAKKLIKRNKFKPAKSQRLYFPMLIIKQQQKMHLHPYEDVLIVTSKRAMKMFGDTQILQLAFGKNHQPESKFDN